MQDRYSVFCGSAVLLKVKRRLINGKFLCIVAIFIIIIAFINRNHDVMKAENGVPTHSKNREVLREEKENREGQQQNVLKFLSETKAGSIVKDIEQIHQDRKRKLRQTCAGKENAFAGHYNTNLVKSRILIDLEQNIAYCSIEKIGSTFWKRIFKILTRKSDAENPFDLNPAAATGTKFETLMNLRKEAVQPFLNTSTKFLFVREPYARLFSGYGDKLFSPNTLFWGLIGTYAVKLVRKNANQVSLKCGHDLTFAEFVKYVIHAEENNVKRNGHFSPSFDHCQPCRYKYDIVGKLETLKNDTLYILDRIGENGLKESLMKNFDSGTVHDTIDDQVSWLFGLRKQYVGCMSFYDAQRKMWKKFQMRGIISKNSKYPVTKDQSEMITKKQYTKYVYDGMGDAKDKTVAKRNKEEALIEAYSTVDKKDLEKLSKIFHPDCELFDYDCRPDKIFKQTAVIKPWYLDIRTA